MSSGVNCSQWHHRQALPSRESSSLNVGVGGARPGGGSLFVWSVFLLFSVSCREEIFVAGLDKLRRLPLVPSCGLFVRTYEYASKSNPPSRRPAPSENLISSSSMPKPISPNQLLRTLHVKPSRSPALRPPPVYDKPKAKLTQLYYCNLSVLSQEITNCSRFLTLHTSLPCRFWTQISFC